MIHVGVIGAGAWGTNLIRNVVASPLTELLGVCDSDEAARRRVVETYKHVVTVPDTVPEIFDCPTRFRYRTGTSLMRSPFFTALVCISTFQP